MRTTLLKNSNSIWLDAAIARIIIKIWLNVFAIRLCAENKDKPCEQFSAVELSVSNNVTHDILCVSLRQTPFGFFFSVSSLILHINWNSTRIASIKLFRIWAEHKSEVTTFKLEHCFIKCWFYYVWLLFDDDGGADTFRIRRPFHNCLCWFQHKFIMFITLNDNSSCSSASNRISITLSSFEDAHMMRRSNFMPSVDLATISLIRIKAFLSRSIKI